jgi:hypothetical protein
MRTDDNRLAVFAGAFEADIEIAAGIDPGR